MSVWFSSINIMLFYTIKHKDRNTLILTIIFNALILTFILAFLVLNAKHKDLIILVLTIILRALILTISSSLQFGVHLL